MTDHNTGGIILHLPSAWGYFSSPIERCPQTVWRKKADQSSTLEEIDYINYDDDDDYDYDYDYDYH